MRMLKAETHRVLAFKMRIIPRPNIAAIEIALRVSAIRMGLVLPRAARAVIIRQLSGQVSALVDEAKWFAA